MNDERGASFRPCGADRMRITPPFAGSLRPICRRRILSARSLLSRLVVAHCAAALLVSPAPTVADGEVILHISDTHVTPDSVGNLPNFIRVANEVADGVALVAHSGDATEDPTSAAYFDTLWDQMRRLTVASIIVPGNHDLTGSRPGAGWVFPRYSQAAAGELMVIGYPSHRIDWDLVEQMMRGAARGGKKIILMGHVPMLTPRWLTSCADGPCRAPVWLMGGAGKARLQELIAKYDVAALLVGHLHTQYQMRDPDLLYDQIATAGLGSGANDRGSYSTVIFDGGNFVAQMTPCDEPPVAITSPVCYDAESGVGEILEPAPIRVRIVGEAEAARVRAVTVTEPTCQEATQVASGVWETTSDWALLAGLGNRQLKASLLYENGAERTVSIPIQVAADYPNLAPTVTLSVGEETGSHIPVTVSVSDGADELSRAELYVDGARVQSWPLGGTSAATLAWDWDTAGNPGSSLKAKVVDIFGRKRYAHWSGPAGQPTKVAAPTPTALAAPPMIPDTGACAAGRVTLKPTLDTYIFEYSVDAEDANPSQASVLKTAAYSPHYRSLLRFDFGGLPTGAEIVSAHLSLAISSWYFPSGIPPTLSLARLGRAFDDGASWTQAKAFDPAASWAQALADFLWVKAGAAASGTDYLNPTVEKRLAWGKNTVDITTLAAEWSKEPGERHDLRISLVGSSDSVAFHASEAEHDQPSLTIDYLCTAPSVPVAALPRTGTAARRATQQRRRSPAP